MSDEWDLAGFESLLERRHSCRAFKAEPVPREVIERLLRSAQRAPSDCNIQPWQMLIVEGATLERLREAMGRRAASGAPPVADIAPIERYAGPYQERRRECGWALYGALGIRKGDRVASQVQALENFRFFGAPHLALLTMHESLGPRGLVDCGAYLMTFLLAAACGVATLAQGSIANRVDVIREVLALPAERRVVCGVAFGWPQEAHPANRFRTSRAPADEVVEFRTI